MDRDFANSVIKQQGYVDGSGTVQTILLSSLLALIGVICGVVIGTGESILPLALVFGLAGLVIVFFPQPLFWGTVILGLVVAGVTRLYVPAIQEIRWLLVPTSMALIIHGLMSPRREHDVKFPLFIWFAIAFTLVLCLSSAINSVPTKTAALGVKGYLQAWGIMFGLALIPFDRKTTDTLLKLCLVVAFFQIPLAAHQFFVLVPERVGIGEGVVPVDVVAGSFGANKFGGGENSVLSAYLVITIGFLTALWRNGALKTWLFVLLALPLFWPIAITESKISVFYLLTAFVILAWTFRLGKPSRMIGMAVVFAALIVALVAALIALAPKANQVRSLSDLIEYTWNYNVRSDFAYGDRLSRAGAYRFWAENHLHKQPVSTLLGNGAGITRKESPSQVLATEDKFDLTLEIGRTGATAILWETGIVGLTFIIAMFLSAMTLAGRLARRFRDDPASSALLTGTQVGIGVLFVSFLDKSYFVFQVGYQTIFALLLGYLAWWARRAYELDQTARENQKALVPVGEQMSKDDYNEYDFDDDESPRSARDEGISSP